MLKSHNSPTMANGGAINRAAGGKQQPSGSAGDRMVSLRAWVAAQLGEARFSLAPASNDASFRRYFRIRPQEGSTLPALPALPTLDASPAASLIVMDASPDKEDCRPFVQVAGLLAEAGVNVPSVFARDLAQGFLLLSDLGDTTYLSALSTQPALRADALYRDAIAALVAIQLKSRPGVLPEYDRVLLERELMLFPDWYIGKQLGTTLTAAQSLSLRSVFELILANNLAQPQVFVHRDYHSRNLMLSTPNPGILDFQDAVYGPISYDLVSLLRDAYISWEEQQVLDWCIRYWETARAAGLPVRADFADFYRDFEWMGAQRQLKVLGIFARLCHRDGKDAYLKDQPLVMSYLLKTCQRYRELAPLARLLDDLQPVARRSGYTF